MKKRFCAALALASLFVAVQAFAHEGKQHKGDHEKWPCADDLKAFCPDVKMGDHTAMKKCLDDNESKLSEKCKAGRAKMQAMKKQWEDACGDDVKKLCPGISEDDHKAMHECMDKNKDKFSDKCKAFKAKMKAKWEEKKEHHKGHHEEHDKE